MKGIGGLLAILGIGSFILGFLNMDFILVSWADTWGPTTGIIIRIAMIVVGGALWYLGHKQENA